MNIDKTCCRCKEIKLQSDFHKDKSRVDGHAPVCKSCKQIDSKKYSRLLYNKEYFTTDNGRYTRYKYMLKYYYRLSEEDFQEMLDTTKGVCPVCQRGFTYDRSGTKIVIDHCHSTGMIRGLLCSDCNSGLGLIGDTYESSVRLLKYLKDNNDRI